LTSDERSDPFAEEGMVVHRQNPNRAGIGSQDFISVSLPDNFPDNFSVNQERRRVEDGS
jgi:hypothetical protein